MGGGVGGGGDGVGGWGGGWGLPLEVGRGVPTKPTIWTHTGTKILLKITPLGYQTLKDTHMRPIEIPEILVTGLFPQIWQIMWFELNRGTDCWCLAGLCQGALYLWCTASGEDRKPNRKHKPFKFKRHIIFDMLIREIAINKMQMFCGLNQNNDPLAYLMLHVDGTRPTLNADKPSATLDP